MMLITNPNYMWGTVFEDNHTLAAQMKIGDCLSFGTFEPDVDASTLKIRMPMLWHVIDKNGSKLKLLSYFFFEHTGFWGLHGSTKEYSWKDSEIRHDLNEKYYLSCFTESERNAILTTEVKTTARDASCIITRDKLYVPAREDIEHIPEHLKIGRFLSIDCFTDDTPTVDLGYCFYWLRDPGEYESTNLLVQGHLNSGIVLDNLHQDADEPGVRAVMWVDADKL